ncbi:MAG TPA: hypothetical protein VJK08_00785 [Patescibacteria group bacterium]|nr:hypothetical protein [Patescibacteria group bacterium]
MPTDKELENIKYLLDRAEADIRSVKNILFTAELSGKIKNLSASSGTVIEGIFDGTAMIGPAKKSYQVPANYASKSKLVCGDILKLTILDDGTFLYKQIGPVKRTKLIGELIEIDGGKYVVKTATAQFQVLPASVTYFKASAGDKLTILIPEETTSEWAAVENIIKE